MVPTAPVVNRLIGALPRSERQRFLASCTPIELEFAEVLAEPDDRIRHVYFPTRSLISLVAAIDAGANLEVGMVGNEGMLGIPLVFGMDASGLRCIVQGSGTALRMEARQFRRELARSPVLLRLLQLYVCVVLSQLAQTAACTRFHVVEARLARWLLMTQDRAHSERFRVTHEFLAFMLGVRRVGVTKAASALQTARLIRYHRGNVMVLDRAGLEAASCGCYGADKATYTRVMGSGRVSTRMRGSERNAIGEEPI